MTIRRRKHPVQSPRWSDAAILRQRLKDTIAERDAILASIPARDKAVAQAAVNAAAQRVANDTVTALRDGGWLRSKPGPTIVKRLIRDDEGRIAGVVESDDES